MRIWSVHPRFLDRQALVACWREALLAQSVIEKTHGGYAHHPQLERFRSTPAPLGAIGAYLEHLADEADARGYRFDRSRIRQSVPSPLSVTTGQLDYEWQHLMTKLSERSPDAWRQWHDRVPIPHPSFTLVEGPIASWERPVKRKPGCT